MRAADLARRSASLAAFVSLYRTLPLCGQRDLLSVFTLDLRVFLGVPLVCEALAPRECTLREPSESGTSSSYVTFFSFIAILSQNSLQFFTFGPKKPTYVGNFKIVP